MSVSIMIDGCNYLWMLGDTFRPSVPIDNHLICFFLKLKTGFIAVLFVRHLIYVIVFAQVSSTMFWFIFIVYSGIQIYHQKVVVMNNET
jgi:hypothetical protein